MSTPRRPMLRHRAFWRVFLFGGVLLVAVVGATVAVFAFAFESPPFHRGPERIARLLESMTDGGPEDQARLQVGVEHLKASGWAGVAVYREDGELLAAAGTPIPPPPSGPHEPGPPHRPPKPRGLLGPCGPGGPPGGPHGRGGPPDGPHEPGRPGDRPAMLHLGGEPVMAIPFRLADGSRAYLLQHEPDIKPAGRIITQILTILGVLLAISLFAARRIARPLEQLTDTAGRLAEGDLTVRTGMARKDEVGQLARTMDEMAERLQHRILSEKELLANISHEIRTPLARIRVALELCEDEGATIEELRTKLAGIQGDATELEQLIDDVLVASRLDLAQTGGQDGGAIALRPEATDLTSIVDKAALRFSTAHPEHSLAREVPADLPPIMADPALLRRVLDNLLDNAAKYCEPDQPIEVKASTEGETLRVEVHDRGIGVAEADLDRLFEPFFRTDRSRSREAGGTGLGLTLCKRIVEAHGGSIEAMRREGGGTMMRFSLPSGR